MRRSIDPVRRERALRRRLRSSFSAWARFVLAAEGHAPAAHHLALIAALAAVERGETERLMLLLPPGSAKSTYASLLFPAWWLARHPSGAIITACHTAGLAQQFGRGVRGLLGEHGARLNVALRGDARAAGRFLTRRGGEYYAIGVNGAVTGRRADLALIDDPIRSFADAESERARERLWNWFRSELVTRLKPRGKVVLIIQRSFENALPFVTAARGSTTALALLNHGDGQYALSIDTGITDVMLEAGRNDIEQFLGTATQLESSIAPIAARYASAGKRVWCWTIPPTTYSNDAWTTIANQSFPFATYTTGGTAISSGATTLTTATTVPTTLAGDSVGLNGATTSPAQAIAPGTNVVSVNTGNNTIVISQPTAGTLAAGTKLYFGTPLASGSTIEMQREYFNTYARANYQNGNGACTGLIDVDAIVADQAGSYKWRTDLGQASADGVHPSAALHQAVVNSGILNPSRFTAP